MYVYMYRQVLHGTRTQHGCPLVYHPLLLMQGTRCRPVPSFSLSTRLLCTHAQQLQGGVRVRYAPSPTGFMHLGGLRTALYNYLFARKNDGKFILRVEDTDQNRFVAGATEDIVKTMKWAGLEIDEGPGFGGEHGPYTQSERTKIYQHYATLLLEGGHAYKCFCTGERLAELRSKQMSYDRACLQLSQADLIRLEQANTPYTVRLKVPHQDDPIVVDDLIHGPTSFSTSVVDDQVLLKSDGFPTYHLACVVDDHLMKITHVIRGEEWLSSTPKHVLLYRAFGWKAPLFAHLPLLLNADKTKLSKRHGHASVESYIKKGYLPSAVVNFVALLGWAPPLSPTPTADDELFYCIPSLVSSFSLSSIVLGGCVVNMDKLYWVNTQHMQKMLGTAAGMASLLPVLRPIINSAIIHHIAQPIYSDANSLSLESSTPATQTTPTTPTTPQTKPPSSKVIEDLPVGLPLESVNLSADMVQRHPLLPRLYDTEYVQRVILTVRERLHVVGDIAALSIPFFVEPSFVTRDALEMRKKFWNANIHTQLKALYNILKELPSWDEKSLFEAVREFSKTSAPHTKAQQSGLGVIFNALRLVVMGSSVGAGVPHSLATLGRAAVLHRLARGLNVEEKMSAAY